MEGPMARAEPRWEKSDAERRAEAGIALRDKHIDVLGPRLRDNAKAGLDDDMALFRVMSGGAVLTTQKTATATERELAESGHALIMAFREAVKRYPGASAALRTAVGVGKQLNSAVTQDVLDALHAVAGNAPALLECGAIQADIDQAAQIAIDLAAADKAQTTTQQNRSGSTGDRIDVQLRIEAAIDAIYVAARFAFLTQPAILKRFARLVASGTYKRDTGEDDEGGGGPVA